MEMFKEFSLKSLTIKNRIVMPPMCMYSADADGNVNDFHLIHYAARAMGGIGLMIVEATGVAPNGRLSDWDLGIWADEHILGLRKITDVCRLYGTKSALQINHAGRKCGATTEHILAPSPLQFSDEYQLPVELSKKQINEVVTQFRDAAFRANSAGFDAIEIHGAHGYLINQFLSPLTNQRKDEYGGSIENRVRFMKEILEDVRKVWPEEKPISLRVSASDYVEGGIDINQMINIINHVKGLIDIVHVSSGAVLPTKIKTYPGYQVSFAEAIRKKNAELV